MRSAWAAGLAVSLISSAAFAAEFHVAPNGAASGDGSVDKPWDLATALAHPSSVKPGDTIWLSGGTYSGTFSSSLAGTASAPIVVRNAAGERATIDGGDSGGAGILSVGGAYTWYWGFEVTSSDPGRTTQETGSNPTDIKRGGGVQTIQSAGSAVGVKFINMIVHDTRQGFSFWKDSTDSEIYGCLIYYNGWDAPDRGHGHGIYTQNDTGTKTLRDNVIFGQFGYGIHAYGSDNAYLKNFTIQDNIVFQNGILAVQNPGFTTSILLGGESGTNGYSIVSGAKITDNATFSMDGSDLAGSNNVGYSAGCSSDVSITGNFFAQGTALKLVGCDVAAVTDNTLIGSLDGFTSTDYPTNSYLSAPPSGTNVFVKKNEYEPGRAQIAVYNWESNPSVAVDVGATLASGSSYEVRDVFDYFGTPVKTGTYDGTPIDIPMNALTASDPVGLTKPAHTAPRFGAFVLIGTPGAGGEAGTGAGGTATGGVTSGGGGSGGGKGGNATGGGAGKGGSSSSSDDDSGCGCRLSGRDPSPASLALFLLIALNARRSSRAGRARRSTTR